MTFSKRPIGVRVWVFALLVGCSSSEVTSSPGPVVDGGPSLPRLGMNDVSVLLPIPASPAAAGALGPTSEGERGPLLPQAVYDKIPKFGVKPAQGLDYARMRVVGVRFDGCFPGAAGCEAQVRLVMQPITDKGTTLDSALHLFYRLTETELPELVTGLRKLRALAPEVQDSPLDVHAALVAQGAEGPYGTGLAELVLRYAGEQNLSRMTFFLRAPPVVEEWFFGGFDREGGVLQVMNIVGVGKGNQRVDHITTDGYRYDMTPAATAPENPGVLLSSALAKAATDAERTASLGAFLRMENPEKHGPDQLSCGGCHISTFVTGFARRELQMDVAAHPDAFKSPRDLTVRGESATTPSSLRAFGWFDARPMIANRVVFETAQVVDDFEKRFPPAH